MFHFIRGYFDGDGNVTFFTKKGRRYENTIEECISVSIFSYKNEHLKILQSFLLKYNIQSNIYK